MPIDPQAQPGGTPPAAPTPPTEPPAPPAPPATKMRGATDGAPVAPAPPAAPANGAAGGAPSSGKDPAGKPADAPSGGKGARIAITTDDLKKRIERSKAAALRSVFGTEDLAAAKERLAKLAEYEKQAEAERLKTLSEIERANEERARAIAERDAARRDLALARERETMRAQTQTVSRIASEYIRPEALEEASAALRAHVLKTDPKVVAKWTTEDLAGFFKDYASKKPFMAKSGASAAPAAPAQQQHRTPGGAQTPPPRPRQPAPAQGAQKSLAPGRPDSMSSAEAKAEAARSGYRWLQKSFIVHAATRSPRARPRSTRRISRA